jgi:tRNA G26 N,N-dimethylase Trm1
MPTFGWDWTELQEQALRAQRERERSRLTVAESEQLYLEEIENLQDKIRTLEQQLSVDPAESVGTDEGEFSTDNLVRRIGPEVYSGEISDRLRFAAKTTLSVSDQIGLDERSRAILQRIVDRLPVSPALAELTQDLARAAKDPKRVASELTVLLRRHGYSEKSDNKHIRLEAERDYDGLESITLPKTPSDNRGLKNLRKQIERTLGITKLAD